MLKELKKITWTKPKDLLINFFIVLIFSSVMTGLIYGIDIFSVYMQNIILSLFN